MRESSGDGARRHREGAMVWVRQLVGVRWIDEMGRVDEWRAIGVGGSGEFIVETCRMEIRVEVGVEGGSVERNRCGGRG